MEEILPQVVAYLVMIFALSIVNHLWGFEIMTIVAFSVIYAKQYVNNN